MSSSSLSPYHAPTSPMAPPSSTSLSQAHSTNSQQTQSATQTALQPPPRAKLIPTNTVTLKDGAMVRVRIDATLAVEDVVRQLCINVKIKDPPSMYALRDENGELVTNENMRKKISTKVNLK